jgi:hypothetical protein
MIPVQSSFISAAGWNEDTNRVRIIFAKDGASMEYACPRAEFDSMMADARPGQYFRLNIYKQYNWTRV